MTAADSLAAFFGEEHKLPGLQVMLMPFAFFWFCARVLLASARIHFADLWNFVDLLLGASLGAALACHALRSEWTVPAAAAAAFLAYCRTFAFMRAFQATGHLIRTITTIFYDSPSKTIAVDAVL